MKLQDRDRKILATLAKSASTEAEIVEATKIPPLSIMGILKIMESDGWVKRWEKDESKWTLTVLGRCALLESYCEEAEPPEVGACEVCRTPAPHHKLSCPRNPAPPLRLSANKLN